MNDLSTRIRLLSSQGGLTLPLPGGGSTAARHLALLEIGRADLSVARLVEAHTDAIAIMAERGRTPRIDGVYGVWAS